MNEKKDFTEEYLHVLSDSLEPLTHCCECTHGEHFEPHTVHIQYPNCNCNPKNYVLRKNFSENRDFMNFLKEESKKI